MVEGVTKGYQKQLEITGVGYKAEVKPVRAAARARLLAHDRVQGAGGDQAHRAAADAGRRSTARTRRSSVRSPRRLRGLRPPEPYKGKGIRYAGEVIRRKAGKAGGK